MTAADHAARLTRLADAAAKRAVDLVGAALLLLALSPVMLLLAALVRFSSPGPIFFRQHRVGQGGSHFALLKFRTMRVAGTGPSVTARGDDRITPVGRWLRRWKLDELPQLVNVFRGEMSLVGPRPEVPEYVRRYTEEQRRVLAVRPGVTGVSQLEFRHEEALLAGRDDVEAFYLDAVMPAKLRLDLRYVRERTLVEDLRLLLRTVAAIAGRSPGMPSTPLH
jgi:lipopolysaccharide/colanic/teichoic acid biosynthesis glycosyltransferase